MNFNNVPLIPRKVLFGNPDRAQVRISPDGAHLAWLAPLDGVLNVWVAPRDDLSAARPVTHDAGRGIRYYLWAYTNAHILYIQDKNGDENWRLYAVDLADDSARDLTPFEGVQAQPTGVSHKFPREVIVGLNNRDPRWHDIYRLDIATGQLALLLQHDRFSSVIVDDDFRLRYANQMTPDGGWAIYQSAGDEWQLWDAIPAEDMLTTEMAGFDKVNRRLYLRDSRGRDTSALVEVDLGDERQALAGRRSPGGRCRRGMPPHREKRPGCFIRVRPQTLASPRSRDPAGPGRSAQRRRRRGRDREPHAERRILGCAV